MSAGAHALAWAPDGEADAAGLGWSAVPGLLAWIAFLMVFFAVLVGPAVGAALAGPAVGYASGMVSPGQEAPSAAEGRACCLASAATDALVAAASRLEG